MCWRGASVAQEAWFMFRASDMHQRTAVPGNMSPQMMRGGGGGDDSSAGKALCL